MVGDFNTSLLHMDRPTSQKISKDIVGLNSTIYKVVIIGIYRLLHLIIADYIFFLSSHETFTKIYHILGHTTHLNKFKRTEII